VFADYAYLCREGLTVFATHGHLFHKDRLPPLRRGEVLLHGHTHIPELKQLACGISIFNPGSVSLPKGGSARSIGYFNGTALEHHAI
jgi:predicted phosphodiesterase